MAGEMAYWAKCFLHCKCEKCGIKTQVNSVVAVCIYDSGTLSMKSVAEIREY